MATEYGNIDDMLMGGTTPSIPQTPESKPDEELQQGPDDVYGEPEQTESEPENPQHDEEPDEPEEPQEKEPDYDDYGNAKAPPKTYTEEEVNERINKAIRERLARGGNGQSQQPTAQQVAQEAQDFDYNPDSAESWETQLAKFVEKTVTNMSTKQAQQQQAQRDQAQQAEFEENFSRGMNRFGDFREVVASQPITDPMTYALREMQDPAAFIYAASKRQPGELARISALASPHAQMMEMAKLEERMRKTAPGTKAPKPVSKSRDDATMPVTQKKKETSIEDLIANSDAKRKAQLQQRRSR